MRNKENILFVLSGASGSGKSTLLKKTVENGLCEQAPKYSNREKREGFDDITHIDNLEEVCDIIYFRNGNIQYGFNSAEVKERLLYSNQIIIVSDISTIEKIRNKFGNEVSTIFVYLQDLHIGNLLKERYALNLSNEEIDLLENHILTCRKEKNKK
jgi:guanylate kinase